MVGIFDEILYFKDKSNLKLLSTDSRSCQKVEQIRFFPRTQPNQLIWSFRGGALGFCSKHNKLIREILKWYVISIVMGRC